MRERDLIIVGAGGFAREAAEAVRAVNAHRHTWRLLGFLDDNPSLHGTTLAGLPVLGPLDLAAERNDAAVLICTGRPDNYLSRRIIAGRLQLEDDRYPVLVHPAATVGSTCKIGPGSVLLANVDLTADVTVGRFVAVMPQVVLTHDVTVDGWVTIASGVRIGGGCHIASEAYVGSGVCVREGLTIGARAMVGMGSVLTRNVPANRLWYGNPARDVSRAPLPVAGDTSNRQK